MKQKRRDRATALYPVSLDYCRTLQTEPFEPVPWYSILSFALQIYTSYITKLIAVNMLYSMF